MYGTMTMVNSNSICCNDSLHSLSASDMYSSSSTEELEEEEGSESMSASEELACGSMKLWLLLSDMAAVWGCDNGIWELRVRRRLWATAAALMKLRAGSTGSMLRVYPGAPLVM